MTHVMALAAGSELVGDFRIERVLGAGGFGITYLAEEIALARKVTIKEYFPADFAARRGARAVPRSDACSGDYDWGLDRFISEAQTLARFDHRNIVRVYRYFRANNTAYMVLHFEEGRSLKGWLAGLGRAPRQNELDEVLLPVLDALETVHAADYLHRDIAPDNIIIRTDGSPVLIDFGSARGDIARHSRTVSALVKPGYSPYEQYAETGSRQGPWSDLYALAATVYFAITGKRPPDAPSRIVKDEMAPATEAAIGAYRRGFLAAIDRALALAIERRPQTVADFRAELMAPEQQRRAWFADRKPATATPGPDERHQAATPPHAAASPSEASQKAIARAASLAEALAEVKADRKLVGEDAAAHLDRLDSLERLQGLPRTAEVRAEVAAHRRARAAGRKPIATMARKAAGVAGALVSSVAAGVRNALPRRIEDSDPAAAPGRARTVRRDATPARQLADAAGAARKPMAAARQAAGTHGMQNRNMLAWSRLPRIEVLRPVGRPDWRRWRTVGAALGVIVLAAGVIEVVRRPPFGTDVIASVFGSGRVDGALKAFAAHDGGVSSVRFANDDGWIVTAGADASLKVWNAWWGGLVRAVRLDKGRATAIAVDGQAALTGHADGTTVLWDLASGRAIATFRRSDAAIEAVAFAAATPRRIVTASADASVAIWDAAKPDKPLDVSDAHDAAVKAVAASKDGRTIVSGGADRTARLFTGSALTLRRSYRGHGDPVTAVALSPSSALIASGAGDGTIRIWSTRSGRRLKILRGHSGAITDLAFDSDGKQLASSAADGSIKLWNVARGRAITVFEGSGSSISALALSADGSKLLSAGADGQVRIWAARAHENVNVTQ